jgi:hypothetical protein
MSPSWAGLTRIAANTLVDVLATARLTRLVTTDVLGDELIVQPARAWAARPVTDLLHSSEPIEPGDLEDAERQAQQRTKLVDGLECPFCVGFWIGLSVIILPIPRTLKRALALNYVVGHMSGRLD